MKNQDQIHFKSRFILSLKPYLYGGCFISLIFNLSGCQSLFSEGSAAGAGIAGAALANKVTDDAALTAGIGIGVQALARAGVQYTLKNMHAETQNNIATAAGPLAEGQIGTWYSDHTLPFEDDEQGRVTVSRHISYGAMECKEIVYSVDQYSINTPNKDPLDNWVDVNTKKIPNNTMIGSSFYVASICKDGTKWAWATSEPATSRWGALQ